MSANTELHGSGVRENEPLSRSGLGRPDAMETEMTNKVKQVSLQLRFRNRDGVNLHKILKTKAKENQRSLNSEIEHRLVHSFEEHNTWKIIQLAIREEFSRIREELSR